MARKKYDDGDWQKVLDVKSTMIANFIWLGEIIFIFIIFWTGINLVSYEFDDSMRFVLLGIFYFLVTRLWQSRKKLDLQFKFVWQKK